MDFAKPTNSSNCLINLSSSDESVVFEAEKKKFEKTTEHNSQQNFEEIPQDFPSSELWWPVSGENNNEEWGLPSSKENHTPNCKELRNGLKRANKESVIQKPKGFSDKWMQEEVLEAASLLHKKPERDAIHEDTCMEYDEKINDAEISNVEVSFSRRIVFRDDPSNIFTTLQLEKQVIERTHVAPKSIKQRVFLNCQPNQFEMLNDTVLLSSGEQADKQKVESQDDVNAEKWCFYEKVTRHVKPIEPRKYATFSYEVIYEHTYYVPTDAPPIEFYFGTMKDK